MGLAQTLKFDYEESQDLIHFLDWLCEGLAYAKSDDKWTVVKYENDQMNFEITIVKDGLATHRSGDYYAFLGFMVEHISGRYGAVTIEDL